MAKGIDRNGIPSSMIWTFVIRGGEPFELKVTGKLGPVLNHGGAMTVWKMVGTEEEAASIESMVIGPLIGARVERHTEIETEDMIAIRNERLGRTADPSEE